MISVRRRRGITLLEVMVAVGLFTVTTMGLMTAWPMQARAVDTSRDLLTATAIAEREMENAQSVGYAVANRSVDESITAWVNGAAAVTTYHAQTTVTVPRTGIKDVAVRVTWTDGGVTHAVSLETLIAPPQ